MVVTSLEVDVFFGTERDDEEACKRRMAVGPGRVSVEFLKSPLLTE